MPSHTILIVDDQPSNLSTLDSLFEQTGEDYEILQALNGESALRIAEAERPDLAIIDWDMPGMSGIELTRALKSRPETEDIMVIMCSGVMMTAQHLQTALEAGASDYVRKPVDEVELQARTRSMIKLGESYKTIKKQHRELQDSFAQMEVLAKTGPLTKLANRRAFLERSETIWQVANRSERPFGLLLADLDHFKRVNDQYGHASGDRLLQQVAARLTSSVRAQDVVGRWGGEEFIVLLPETDLAGSLNLAEKIRLNIETTAFDLQEMTLKASLSIGVSHYEKGLSLEKCIQHADEALYQSKESGRNRVTVYNRG